MELLAESSSGQILSSVITMYGSAANAASGRFHLGNDVIGRPIDSSSSSLYYYKMFTSGWILEFKVSK